MKRPEPTKNVDYGVEFYIKDQIQPYINHLEAENKIMREALFEIASEGPEKDGDFYIDRRDMVNIARAALKGGTDAEA